MTDKTSGTLDEILKDHRRNCSSTFCRNGMNPLQSCMDYARIEKAFELGKEVGRKEALRNPYAKGV